MELWLLLDTKVPKNKGAEMQKAAVIKHFGNQSEVARVLGISHNAVGKWGKVIPLLRAYQIQSLDGCDLEVDLSLYDSNAQPKSAA